MKETEEKLTYLACPFNHVDPSVREKRYNLASSYASKLMREGHLVFCPLSHNLPILHYGLPIGWDFWEKFNRSFLERCDRLLVLKLEGWKESIGVQSEIKIAQELNIPIEYVAPVEATAV